MKTFDRFRILTLILAVVLVFFGSPVFGAVFKVNAPAIWQRVQEEDGVVVYVNTRSRQNETVVIHSMPIDNDGQSLFNHLENDASELARARGLVYSRLGLADYAVLSIERKKSKFPRFKSMLMIQSSHIDFAGRDVQTLERQLLSGSTLFVITYQIDAPALNDRGRAEMALDYFQPISKAEREPASQEALMAVGSSVLRTGASTYGQREDLVRDLDMKDPKNSQLCEGIPAEKRRTPEDGAFLGRVVSTLKTPGNCIAGILDNIIGMFKGLGEIAWAGLKYANPFSSSYRSQINASIGSVVADARKDFPAFVRRVASEVWNFTSEAAGKWYQCLKTEAQVRIFCDLATNFIPNGLLVKLFTKAPLSVLEKAEGYKIVRDRLNLNEDRALAQNGPAAREIAESKGLPESPKTNGKNFAGETQASGAQVPTKDSQPMADHSRALPRVAPAGELAPAETSAVTLALANLSHDEPANKALLAAIHSGRGAVDQQLVQAMAMFKDSDIAIRAINEMDDLTIAKRASLVAALNNAQRALKSIRLRYGKLLDSPGESESEIVARIFTLEKKHPPAEIEAAIRDSEVSCAVR